MASAPTRRSRFTGGWRWRGWRRYWRLMRRQPPARELGNGACDCAGMIDDYWFGENVLVFPDNEAFAQLSEGERAAYIEKAVRAMRSGVGVITPKTPSLPRFMPEQLISLLPGRRRRSRSRRIRRAPGAS